MVLLHPGQLPMGPATVSGAGMFGMHAADHAHFVF